MKRVALILALLAVSTQGRSDGIYNPHSGEVGFIDGINNLGAGTGGGGGCTMNGKFDLTLTCNDIYFIGGLK